MIANYDKYANMDTKQLASALINAKKKEQKYIAESRAKIKNMQELIRFLKSKLKESVDEPQYEFKTLDEWGLTNIAKEVEKQFTPQELDKIRQEVKAEMMEQSDEL